MYPDYYFVNETLTGPNSSFVSIELLGANGERNQQGRVVRVTPQQHTSTTYTRVVDSGSGYHTQNQYALLIGTNYGGLHVAQALLPAPTKGPPPILVRFNVTPGKYVQVFAPSQQYPAGRVLTYDEPPPPAPSRCINWLLPALGLIVD